MEPASLSSLPSEILREIFDILLLSYGSDGGICRMRKSFDSLSRSNKNFRNACLPFLFHTCSIQGDWTHAAKGLEALSRNLALASYMK